MTRPEHCQRRCAVSEVVFWSELGSARRVRPPIHDTFANHVVQAGIDLALEGEENAAGFRLGREHWELNIFELEDMSAARGG